MFREALHHKSKRRQCTFYVEQLCRKGPGGSDRQGAEYDQECTGQQRRSAASWSVLGWAQTEIKKSDFSSTQHFLGPHLDYCVQFGAHQYKKHSGWLEQVQQRAKMIRDLEHSPCDRRLREWDLFILQSEMFRLDIKKIFSPWGQSPLEQEPREAVQSMFGSCKEVVKFCLSRLFCLYLVLLCLKGHFFCASMLLFFYAVPDTMRSWQTGELLDTTC